VGSSSARASTAMRRRPRLVLETNEVSESGGEGEDLNRAEKKGREEAVTSNLLLLLSGGHRQWRSPRSRGRPRIGLSVSAVVRGVGE
jgi:hypothetical protein